MSFKLTVGEVVVIIILVFVVTVIFINVELSRQEVKNFCEEEKGGKYIVFDGGKCLIENDGIIEVWNIIEYKGELRLAKTEVID